MSIKNVAVAGGSGNLGPDVLKGLLDEGFNVTVLSREESKATFPTGCTVKRVKYDNLESLKAALTGQDAVVSTMNHMAEAAQTLLIDAAVAAGVKRYIPSEFGINTRTVKGPIAVMLTGKVKIVDYLMEKAKSNPTFSWTGMCNGLFFNWCLDFGICGPTPGKTYIIRDSGNEPFSAADLSYVGKCVSGILKHPEETANKYLTIAGFTTTQNEILAFVEKETGSKWKVERVDMKELKKSGEEKLAKGEFLAAFLDLLVAHVWSDGAGGAVPDAENAARMLGVAPQSWQDTVRAWLKKNSLVA